MSKKYSTPNTTGPRSHNFRISGTRDITYEQKGAMYPSIVFSLCSGHSYFKWPTSNLEEKQPIVVPFGLWALGTFHFSIFNFRPFIMFANLRATARRSVLSGDLYYTAIITSMIGGSFMGAAGGVYFAVSQRNPGLHVPVTKRFMETAICVTTGLTIGGIGGFVIGLCSPVTFPAMAMGVGSACVITGIESLRSSGKYGDSDSIHTPK